MDTNTCFFKPLPKQFTFMCRYIFFVANSSCISFGHEQKSKLVFLRQNKAKKVLEEFQVCCIFHIFTDKLNKPWLRVGHRLPGLVLVSANMLKIEETGNSSSGKPSSTSSKYSKSLERAIKSWYQMYCKSNSSTVVLLRIVFFKDFQKSVL